MKELKFIMLKIFITYSLMFFSQFTIAAETCELSYQLTDSLNKIYCLDKLPFGKRKFKNYDKPLIEVAKNSKCWSLAIPIEASCNVIGFSSAHPIHCGHPQATEFRSKAALGACEATGCKCSLVIKNNDIVDSQLFFSYAMRDSDLLAKEKTANETESNIKKISEPAHKQSLENSSKFNLIVTNSDPDASGIVTINIQTNTDTSSLKINGEELGRKFDGIYTVKKVVRVGQETKFNIVGIDVNGNADSKTIAVFRQAAESKVVFGQLNAANVKQQPASEAVAIIIGIEKYKRVAKADYANADAQDFYDYANRALGIKPENIKLLVDDGADDVEILQAFQNWLPLKVKKGKTDVYVFFSGHGYPSEDGKGLYFLPYGVDKNYMDRTAVKQKEVIAALQSVKPKSVTMFIDSCYSGQTRGGETLVAGSKPIALKQSETAYPPDFTVITASTMDQISWSSPDLKHGLFSYYLMKGMEGDSDLNKDGKVTVAEMQEYLTDMVGRHAMGMNRSQQPQLFGDPNKVLISR